jgi:cytosine/adenosine deaminase-related metal-dependent hydrolase
VLLLLGGARVLPALLLGTIAAGWMAQLLSLAVVYPLIGARRRHLVWYPLGAWIVGRILLRTARDLEDRKPVTWGGRRYVPEPR